MCIATTATCGFCSLLCRVRFLRGSDCRHHFELGPATVIHPDSIAVVTPGRALGAGTLTHLAHQAHSAAGIERADPALHIIGPAYNEERFGGCGARLLTRRAHPGGVV